MNLSSKPRRSDARSEKRPGPQFPEDISATEIREQLQTMLASEIFVRSERLSRFLRFIVEKALAGEGKLLNQYVIALEVFDKPAGFDPNVDPVIRVEAGRLRSKIREYYATSGQFDPLVINLAKVGYCPAFARRHAVKPFASRLDEQLESRPALAPLMGAESTHAVPLPGDTPAYCERKQPVSIAVLPFTKLSPDDSHRLCEEIYQRVLQELVLTGGFLVRAGNRQQSAEIENTQEIARKLNTELFLEGSLQQSNGQVRIYAMLARSSDGYGIWADSYNRTLAGAMSSEHEIARAIVESVVKALRPPPEATSATI